MESRTRNALVVSLATVLGLAGVNAAWGLGGQMGLQFAIDAPWRMEPIVDGRQLRYGPIPINVVFLDAIFDETRELEKRAFMNRVRVGRLVRIDVVERTGSGSVPGAGGTLTRILPRDLQDIQLKRNISIRAAEPPMLVCEPSAGADCSDFLDITRTHEWHTMFYYRPHGAMLPGTNVHLEVTVVTVRDGDERRFRNDLVVHLGEAPLPRFSDQWLYGDLHYHSQMTDNEGESGYSYRNSVRGLTAIGMDYVFATDHASNSVQVDGGFSISSCKPIRGMHCMARRPPASCPGGEQVLTCHGKEARDLNQARYNRGLAEIDLANRAIAADASRGLLPSIANRGVVPQIYMGEEIDAWPQMSHEDFRRSYIAYGDGLRYIWAHVPNCPKRNENECKHHYAAQPGGPNSPVMVLDEQGVTFKKLLGELGIDAPWDDDPKPTRQHIVYFPFGTGDARQGFVPSDTGPAGGARHSLAHQIRAMEGKGSAFLAHPLISSKPGSAFGPDVVPYSFESLDIAWSSSAILGLQLWNENERVESTVGDRNIPKVMAADNDGEKSFTYLLPWREGTVRGSPRKQWQEEVFLGPRLAKIRHGISVWDRYLQKGLDPAEVAKLPWAAEGYPRRWFMAGGSDGHGDLNYRRAGRPAHEKIDGRCNEFWCDFNVNDTALGKPRNLTFVRRASGQTAIAGGSARVHTNLDVIGALESGAFTVTDGPALRVVLDRDRDGRIEDDDFQMGSVARIFPGDHIPLLVEWISTPEFGPVERVDLYVGNKEVVFAPPEHGPGNPTVAVNRYVPDRSGGHLQFEVPPELGMHGQATVFLAPEDVAVNAQNNFFYIRAFAQTATDGCPSRLIAGVSCGERFAFTNPVWGEYLPYCADSSRSIDADDNGKPDVCETKIEDDPCLTKAQELTSRRPNTTDNQQAPATSGASSGGASGGAFGGRFGDVIARTPVQRATVVTSDGQKRTAPVNEERWESCSSLGPAKTGRPFDRVTQPATQQLRRD